MNGIVVRLLLYVDKWDRTGYWSYDLVPSSLLLYESLTPPHHPPHQIFIISQVSSPCVDWGLKDLRVYRLTELLRTFVDVITNGHSVLTICIRLVNFCKNPIFHHRTNSEPSSTLEKCGHTSLSCWTDPFVNTIEMCKLDCHKIS